MGGLKPVLRRQDGALSRGEPMPHHLFTGASGLGKSLLARTLAERAKAKTFRVRSDETPEEVVAKFRQMERCDVAFFDECHRLDHAVQELLYEVIDSSTVPAKLVASAGGPEAVTIAPVTMIFATDQPGRLLNALLKRIPATVRFKPYPENELKEIVARIAARAGVLLSAQAARQVARVCNGVPRRAEHRVADLRLYFGDSERRQLGLPDVEDYLHSQGIDGDGLGEDEHTYLEFLSRNGSASLGALAGHLGIDTEYVRTQIEQPLLYRGLVMVRSSGRQLTRDGEKRVEQRGQSLKAKEPESNNGD
jgi:Holliday junction DNA helicase RuvB